MIRDGVIYRVAGWSDISGLVDLERRKWDEELVAGRDKWESRLGIFSEGVRVAEFKNRIIGVSAVHIVDYPDVGNGEYPTWEEITDNGYITNHNSNGNKVYGVDFAVDSSKPRVAYNLQEAILHDVVRPRGLAWRVGYTAPFICEYQKKYGVGKLSEDKVLELALKDPIVNNLFFKQGFELIGVSENYFARDKLSDGWGIILEAQ